MRALLLAAGFGKRLRPITDNLPKCLVPIRGRPLLDYWLEILLQENRIEHVLINTHYLPEQVREYVSGSDWKDRVTLVHEDSLLGTGGTVLANRTFLDTGPFVVAHADNLTELDISEFVQCHAARASGTDMTMALFRTDTPQSCGIVQLDSLGRVIEFHEKVENPPGNLANGAVYIFEPDIFTTLASLGKPVIDLSLDIIASRLGRIQGFETTGYYRDIGTVSNLRAAEREFPVKRDDQVRNQV